MTRNTRKMEHKRLTEQRREARWLRRQRRGSVQQGFVRARSVHDSLLCLAVPGNRQAYAFVTILEIEGISYDLKSPEEQRLLNEQFQALLAGLHYPIQILWRVLPLRLQDYLAHFALDEARQNSSEDASEEKLLQELAHAHTTFLQQYAARRMLLHRRVYLVLRTDAVSRSQSQWHTLFGRRQRAAQRFAEQLEHARQVLDLRVEELTRMLSGMMNFPVRRLRGPHELVPFYYSCLTPQKADQYPLPVEMLDALERPVHAADITGKLGRENISASPLEYVQKQSSGARKRGHDGRDETLDDLTSLSNLTAPAGIRLAADHLTVEHEQVRVLIIQHLPRVVSSGWLKPLADLDEPMEVSFHLQPRHSAFMIQQFRRRQMEYQSSRQLARSKGNEVDPHTKIAEEDVSDLILRLASGEERMLDATMLILLRGASRGVLDERTERVRATLHNMLLVAREALFEQDKAFRSCLPHGRNELSGILLDSRSASTLFPFLSNSLFHPDGILEGITPQGDPVLLDAWGPGMANANRLILGPPGWGKSHYVKTMLMRLALKYRCAQQHSGTERNFQLITIDPEREYRSIALPFRGQMVRLAPGSQHHLNPFDLPRPTGGDAYEHGDRLADHIQKLHTLLEIMLADRTPQGGAGKLDSQEKGLLDRALYEAYRRVGITSEVKTHDRPAPLMRDLYDILESKVCGPDMTGLTPRLRRFVHGSLAGLFAGPTNVQLDQMIVNFDIHDLETELRPIGLFLVSNFVWTESFHSRIPRLLVVDEAATLYHYESGASFLEDFVRRARKYYVGVILISQHPLLFQQSSIPANCATKVLMRQDATTLDLLEQMLKLSWREVQLLRHLPIGEALLLTGEKRLHVRFEASALEHLLATTDPQEIATWGEETFQSASDVLAWLQASGERPPQRPQEEQEPNPLSPVLYNTTLDMAPLPLHLQSAASQNGGTQA